MRVCAISLPDLRIEMSRARANAKQQTPAEQESLSFVAIEEERTREVPLAVVVAPAPMTETKLLGNTRLSVVSHEARALGVLPGHTIAQARARAGDLTVRVVRPDAVRDVLARLAEVGLAFGATVSFDMAGGSLNDFGDVVWIDVTGCAHLHAPSSASSIFDGETILASRLAGVIASLGHTCSVAIADGPRVAAMLARSAAEAAARDRALATRNRRRADKIDLFEPIIVRPGDNAVAIGSLSVAMLPLPHEDIRWLTKLGVRTIHELRQLPREGLGTRLGVRAREILSLAFGEDRAPLAPYVPPEVPVEEATLEYGIEGSQALTFVAKTLTDRLASRLQGRAVAAARVELELHLDAAMLPDISNANRTDRDRDRDRDRNRNRDREGPPSTSLNRRPPTKAERSRIVVAVDLPAPLSLAGDLLAALRPKIERLYLEAPVLGAKLRAPVLVHKRAAALSLFEPQPKAERALPRLVAELVSDLGNDAVSKLVLGDSWVPEERSKLVPFSYAPNARSKHTDRERERERELRADKEKKQKRFKLSSVPEPTRLLAEPRIVQRDHVRVTRHLSRVEALEWWKVVPSAPAQGQRESRRPVDYVEAWIDDGAAWIEIDRTTGTMRVLGLFD